MWALRIGRGSYGEGPLSKGGGADGDGKANRCTPAAQLEAGRVRTSFQMGWRPWAWRPWTMTEIESGVSLHSCMAFTTVW